MESICRKCKRGREVLDDENGVSVGCVFLFQGSAKGIGRDEPQIAISADSVSHGWITSNTRPDGSEVNPSAKFNFINGQIITIGTRDCDKFEAI